MLKPCIFANPTEAMRMIKPSEPLLLFSRKSLENRITQFQSGFDGLVTFAVKSNPHPKVLGAMLDAGLRGFDVASPHEIKSMRGLAKDIALHYNNPIRSHDEIQRALENRITSFSVDCLEELEKLGNLCTPQDIELSIRLRLDLDGAAYHFGEKFGATMDEAEMLLKHAKARGFRTSMTFHVGTQCEKPALYKIYMQSCAQIATKAGVALERLNIGGGFPSAKDGVPRDYDHYFSEIRAGQKAFGANCPALVCEPGRALIGDAAALLVRVKSIRKGQWAFLNDGIYGGLSEMNLIANENYQAFHPKGTPIMGTSKPITIFGPTCDSIDTLKTKLNLPENISEGDYILFGSAGAYTIGVNTRFNGYGHVELVEVKTL